MILFIPIAFLGLIAAVTAWVEFHEVVSEVKVLNPEGDRGKALVVYQKGLRDFQPKVAFAFAEGLVSAGWRVEITTVSSRAPTDISGYDLLVLGWPPTGSTHRCLFDATYGELETSKVGKP